MNDLRPKEVHPPQLPPGTRLNDIYEIEALLASGGMGSVYRARAIETNDVVAIKTIRPELAGDKATMAMFRREATALHQVYHEAIVRYFVFSVDRALNQPYLAMEFVEGDPLGQRLKRGPLSFDATVALMKRVASGLRAAHDNGIVHRDISPDNIIIPEGDVARARIIDFGIARALLAESTIVGTGLAGKFAYMSPEQLGLFGGEVTPSSDIYSLGLVLAQCLLGRPLDMLGSHQEILDKRRQVPDLSGLDARMQPLLRSVLASDPRDRPPSMMSLIEWKPQTEGGAAKIERQSAPVSLRAGRQTPSRPGGPVPGAFGWRRLAAFLTAVFLAGGGGLAYWWWQHREASGVTFVRTYPLDPCMALIPTEAGRNMLKVVAYGNDIENFVRFDEAFKAKLNYEAEIDLRQITLGQCPVGTFVGALRPAITDGPILSVAEARYHDGDDLVGSMKPAGSWSSVLHIRDDGVVTKLKEASSREQFRVHLQRSSGGPGLPQLLLALDSDVPLATIDQLQGSAQAEGFFTDVLAEARSRKAALKPAIAYFKVD
jgi:hypothetical protein